MALRDSYEPAGPDIVSEEIDGEVIIVNLRNGNYYSLGQSAADIWGGIQEHATLERLHARLQRRYADANGAMGRDLAELIRALEAEELITRSATDGPADRVPATDAGAAGEKEPY